MRRRATAFCLASFVFARVLSGDGAMAQPRIPGVSPGPEGTAAPAHVAADSPRASVQRFHEMALRGRWDEAARYLDLAPAQTPDGPRLARELVEVIDQHFGWDADSLSPDSQGDAEDGLPPRVDEVGEIAIGRGRFVPVRVTRKEPADGARWVFTRSTVQRIDDWYDALEGRWARDHLPPSLNARGPRDLRRWQWLALPVLAALALALGRLAAAAVRRVIDRLVGRISPAGDDAVGVRSIGPVTLLAAAGAMRAGVLLLTLSRDGEDFVLAGLSALTFAALFWVLWRAVELFGRAGSESAWATEHPARVTLVSLGVKVSRVLIGAAAVVVVLSALGYPIASLVAGLGIGGLALALAAQKTGEHLFGTLAIGIDQPFRVGDWVKVDDQEGTVEAVGLRSTRIRTLDRTLISIPNGKLADMRSEQVSARDRYRVHASLTVAFGTPADTLRALMTELRAVLAAHPKAHTDGPWVFLRRVGDSGMEVEVSAWFTCEGYEAFLQLRSEVLLSVLDRVERAGVTLAYPTRTVLLHGPPTAR